MTIQADTRINEDGSLYFKAYGHVLTFRKINDTTWHEHYFYPGTRASDGGGPHHLDHGKVTTEQLLDNCAAYASYHKPPTDPTFIAARQEIKASFKL